MFNQPQNELELIEQTFDTRFRLLRNGIAVRLPHGSQLLAAISPQSLVSLDAESPQNVDNVELGKRGRWRSNVWIYPGASSLGSDARRGLKDHPTVKPTAMVEEPSST